MNVNLPTGNTITISVYEWLFILRDEDMDEFYQSCIADDLGIYVDNPFSSKAKVVDVQDEEEIEL